jgi:hypothetical protein
MQLASGEASISGCPADPGLEAAPPRGCELRAEPFTVPTGAHRPRDPSGAQERCIGTDKIGGRNDRYPRPVCTPVAPAIKIARARIAQASAGAGLGAALGRAHRLSAAMRQPTIAAALAFYCPSLPPARRPGAEHASKFTRASGGASSRSANLLAAIHHRSEARPRSLGAPTTDRGWITRSIRRVVL